MTRVGFNLRFIYEIAQHTNPRDKLRFIVGIWVNLQYLNIIIATQDL